MSTHNDSRVVLGRRSFFAKLGVGVAGGAAVGAAAMPAQAQTPAGPFQPARHAQDDWYDEIPGKHRVVFDVPNPDGLASSLQFLNNYYTVNVGEYGLKDNDLAVVLVTRHMATLFGYGDAIWAKYGKPISDRNGVLDPSTKLPPTVNLQKDRIAGYTKRGLQLAVCQTASRGYAGAIAMATGQTQDAVFAEMKANLLPNARLVPAGIIAVSRAQERGYTLASVER